MTGCIGVFVCDCKGLISDHIDNEIVVNEASALRDVVMVERLRLLALLLLPTLLVAHGARNFSCRIANSLDNRFRVPQLHNADKRAGSSPARSGKARVGVPGKERLVLLHGFIRIANE